MAASPGDQVERVYAQFREAIRELFERQTKSAALAEDLTQTVYWHLLNCRTLAAVTDPKLFIYATAWNVLRTEMRRGAYEERFKVLLKGENEARISANRHLWVDDSTTELDTQLFVEALSGLSDKKLEVFVLHYIDGDTYEAIAERMEITPHTVKKYISEALALLHAHCADDSGDKR